MNLHDTHRKILKPKFANVFMNVAQAFSNLSYCERKKTGAVIVKDGRVIASGYNGTPAGANNECEDGHGNTKHDVIHAEANAILSCAKHGISCQDTVLFCTMSPCPTCAIMIIQAGISVVVYNEVYRVSDGIDILKKSGVEVYSMYDLSYAQSQNDGFAIEYSKSNQPVLWD
jgi:dCMP deaminase